MKLSRLKIFLNSLGRSQDRVESGSWDLEQPRPRQCLGGSAQTTYLQVIVSVTVCVFDDTKRRGTDQFSTLPTIHNHSPSFTDILRIQLSLGYVSGEIDLEMKASTILATSIGSSTR